MVFMRGVIDKTLFHKMHNNDLILVQVYVDDIIFGSTNDNLCKRFAKLMQSKYEMSMMGELSFFLGFQVHQNDRWNIHLSVQVHQRSSQEVSYERVSSSQNSYAYYCQA